MNTDDNKINLDKMPALTMNTTDKLFFALARRDTETLSYVYALVINNMHAGTKTTPEYSPMDTRVEISVFKNVAKANMYFETATLIMEQQQNGVIKGLYEALRNWEFVKNHIDSFNKMTSNFKTRTK